MPFDLLVERSGLGRIDFLKCNIEGAERFLVDSGQQLQKIPELAIACHDFRVRATNDEFFRTRELVSAHLLRLGYKIRHQNTGIGYIDDWVYATRRT